MVSCTHTALARPAASSFCYVSQYMTAAATYAVRADSFQRNDFALIKDRPCRIAGIMSNSKGLCIWGYDLFAPHKRHDAWIVGRRTWWSIPYIDFNEVTLLDESSLDLISGITSPEMLEEIRKAIQAGQAITVEMISWGAEECRVQGFTVSAT